MPKWTWVFICFLMNQIINAAVLPAASLDTVLTNGPISTIVEGIESVLNHKEDLAKSFDEKNNDAANIVELEAIELIPSSIVDDEEKSKTKNDEILSKIEQAIAKSKEVSNTKVPEVLHAPDMVPIFKPMRVGNIDRTCLQCNSNAETSNPTTNSMGSTESDMNKFVITGAVLRPLLNTGTSSTPSPYSAIPVENPATKLVPSARAFTSPVINLGSLADLSKNAPTAQAHTLPNLGPKNDAVVVFYKPETVTVQKCEGDLLKKITMTVLVPLYKSKLDV